MSEEPEETPLPPIDSGPYRTMAREYFAMMRASYVTDKRNRILQGIVVFGIGGAVLAQHASRSDNTLFGGPSWLILVGGGVIGATVSGLTFLIFLFPQLRPVCFAIGGVFLVAALAGYGGMTSLYPTSLLASFGLASLGAGHFFHAGVGLSILGLAFVLAAAASILREVPEPSDSDIESRARMLAAQAHKAAELDASRLTETTSTYTRRRRR